MKEIVLSEKQLVEWPDLAPLLLQVIWLLLREWPGTVFRVNSIHRSREHDRRIKGQTKEEYVPGIHTVGPPYRALDGSIWTLGLPIVPAMAEVAKVARKINEQWIYDPKRPKMVVCYVLPHGEGPHIHLQVHPNTRRR
jgi:hypothetical protein